MSRAYDFSQSAPAHMFKSLFDQEREDYEHVDPITSSLNDLSLCRAENPEDFGTGDIYEEANQENIPEEKFCDHLYDPDCATCVQKYGIRETKRKLTDEEQRGYEEDDSFVEKKRPKLEERN
ncbi:hypothetical protein QR680_006510 [Steinernema hermaphroditum]|uniref:Uncharacterized protein n=1 Tax=Steinernema hermaphroditum TaxID=289476 RepID=A0AA39HY33_9BILA|nr:hypothetical protein QR680_006510 [Steinernema hermaphroditum]